MAEKNSKKLTPFEQQQLEITKQVKGYKVGAEANIVSMIYKNPDLIRECNLTLDDFHENCWRVYFEIAKGVIVDEDKSVLTDIDAGFYLDKHPNLSKKYDEYGGFQTAMDAGGYVQEQNFDAYVQDLRKWNTVLNLIKRGFPCTGEFLSEICDMSAERLYAKYNMYLNDAFANIDSKINTYNGFDGMRELVDELDKGKSVGIPFENAEILSSVIGGMLGGNIIGIGASSGVGKTTLTINYILPVVIHQNYKALFIINEQDQNNVKKEMLCWYCNNELKVKVTKQMLRDGGFTKEVKDALYKASDWFEKEKNKHNITIIPLERYSSRTVVKLIKKYSHMCDIIVLDTLKESCDARGQESWKSLMTDCVDFYDCIKHTNTAMIITYQLVKNKSRYITNADIGISKGILDVFSVNIFFRRPFQDEFDGERNSLHCWDERGAKGNTKPQIKLKKDEHYMIAFVSKNRYGVSDVQIVSNADFSVNKYKDLGFARVVQDF